MRDRLIAIARWYLSSDRPIPLTLYAKLDALGVDMRKFH